MPWKDRANEREDPLAIRLVAKRPHEQQVCAVGRWRIRIEPVDAAVGNDHHPWVIEQRSVLFTASDQRVEAREQHLLPRIRTAAIEIDIMQRNDPFFVGQALFSMRFLIQWIMSERARRSVERWRNYARQMEPALPILEPWAKKLGYTL